VEGKREIVAHPGNLVGSSGLFEDRVGVGAVRAFEIFKFNESDAGSGRGLEGGWVMDLRPGRERAKLGVGGRNGQKEGGGGEKN
jgi:hypothetical protein